MALLLTYSIYYYQPEITEGFELRNDGAIFKVKISCDIKPFNVSLNPFC